jgi:hypothetical protein
MRLLFHEAILRLGIYQLGACVFTEYLYAACSCKIDKVRNVIESNRPDTRNALYRETCLSEPLLFCEAVASFPMLICIVSKPCLASLLGMRVIGIAF